MKGGKPFMKFGLEQMNDIIDRMITDKLSHQNYVVIGDNSSGKSLLLKNFIKKIDYNEIYFIDAVNRGFDVKMISKTARKPEYKTTIIETRMRDEYFNLVDSFNCYGTLTERIEMIYELYQEEVQDLFYKLTGDRIEISYVITEGLGQVDYGFWIGLLSSGYQAIVRILLELLYYQDMVVSKQPKKYWIVIDEIDEFLSPKYSALILEFLKEEFPWAKWLVSTHSCDLIANTSDADLIVLSNNDCEVMDIDDYASVSEVQIIFERLFGKMTIADSEIENTLRRLLHNKMSNAWGSHDDACLDKLKGEKLSASQKVILKQIQEW